MVHIDLDSADVSLNHLYATFGEISLQMHLLNNNNTKYMCMIRLSQI